MIEGEEKVPYFLDKIKRIQDEHVTIDNYRSEAYDYFHAEENFSDKLPIEQGFSTVVSKDLFSTVSSVIPMLMKPLTDPTNEIFQIEPRTEEDVEPAEDMTILIDYFLRTRNNWTLIVHDFIQDALLGDYGVFGYEWCTEEYKEEKEYEKLTPQELALLSTNAEQKEVTEVIPEDDSQNVLYNAKLEVTKGKYEYPKICALRSEDVKFSVNTKNVKECSFLYKSCYLEEFEIRRDYGNDVFEKIKEYKTYYQRGDWDTDNVYYSRLNDLGGETFFYSEQDDLWLFHEIYYIEQETGKPRKAIICGNYLVSDEDNEYKRPCVVVGNTYRMAHRVIGVSMHKIVKQYQEINTSIFRQVMNNLYYRNQGRIVYDPMRMDPQDIIDNNQPGGLIPSQGGPGGAYEYMGAEPLPPDLHRYVEFFRDTKEADTGVTRYSQGIDAKSLNKTARGMQMIMSMAQQRIEMMLTFISEAIKELVTETIFMVERFMKDDVAVRVLNDWKRLRPDNTKGQFDINIKAGIGVTQKDFLVAQIQQMLALFQQVQASGGVNIITPDNIYNALKLLIASMGFQNYRDYITDPEIMKVLMAHIQTIIGFMQQNKVLVPEIAMSIEALIQAFGINPQELSQPMGGNPANLGRTPDGAGMGELPPQPQAPASPQSGDY